MELGEMYRKRADVEHEIGCLLTNLCKETGLKLTRIKGFVRGTNLNPDEPVDGECTVDIRLSL